MVTEREIDYRSSMSTKLIRDNYKSIKINDHLRYINYQIENYKIDCIDTGKSINQS